MDRWEAIKSVGSSVLGGFLASSAKKIEENGVRYEFGPCLYLGYVFGFIAKE